MDTIVDTLECQTELMESLFVNRRDIYAVQNGDGSWRLVKRPLTSEVLSRHFEGILTAGVYQLDENDEVKWLCLDFDSKNAECDARKVFVVIKNTKFARAALLEHTGGRGYHVWVFFQNKVKAWQAKKIAEEFVEGTSAKCEIYPKQAKIVKGGYGNLVRLPLGIHRKTGQRSKLMDPEHLDEVVPIFVEPGPVDGYQEHVNDDEAHRYEHNPYPCWRKMFEGVSEGARREVAFALARHLRYAGCLKEQQCATVLLDWNNKNNPPLMEQEVRSAVRRTYDKGYPNIGCVQIKSHDVLKQFCDDRLCSRKTIINNVVSLEDNLNDEALFTKHWAFIVKWLGGANSKIRKIQRYNDTAAVERMKSKLDNLQSRDNLTEEELKMECGVRSLRTPRNQRILFIHSFFIGELSIYNKDRDLVWPKLVWYIRILGADGPEPMPACVCLITITPKRFKDAGLDDPVSAFPGTCIISANAKGDIIEVETNIEERI